jgi:hypothetical protein
MSTIKLFNNEIKASTYKMAKTELDDPMCACEICGKQFREYNFLHRTQITEPSGINYADLLNIPRATEKSTKRIDNILHSIEKAKIGSHKKYQVKGYYEYKEISKKLNENGVRHELEISDTLFMKKLSEMDVYVNTKYIQQRYASYKNDDVKCMYVKVWK